MRNKFYLLFLSSHLLLLNSCGEKNQDLENVDTIMVTHSELIDLESKNILNPVNYFKIDGYSVFRNHLTTTGVFSFMADNSGEVISGINIGNGPNEVTQVMFPQRYNDDVFVMDIGHQTLNKVFLRGDSVAIDKKFKCEFPVGASFSILCGNRFVAPTSPMFTNAGLLALIDSVGTAIAILEYPKELPISNMDPGLLATFYCNSKVAVSPDEKHYAYGVHAESVFGFGDITDDNFSIAKTLIYNTVNVAESDRGRIVPYGDNIRSTLRVVPSEKYAIFLYSAKRLEEETGINTTNTLLLFTWSGELYKKILLDMELKTIDFDDRTKTLYGIAFSPEACLVKYNLSGLF